MAEKCADCGKTGVDLIGLGGSGVGARRKLCVECCVAAMDRAREVRDRALRAMGEQRGETYCGAIEQTGFLEYRCGISGVSVEGDCDSLSGGLCVPLKALAVHKGRVAIEEVSAGERDAVLALVARLRGEEYVPAFVERQRRKADRRARGWTWTSEQRARMSEVKRRYWAARRGESVGKERVK